MAKGYLNFSPLIMGHTNDRTGDYYSQAIGNVSDAASNLIEQQGQQRQNIYGQIEESKRLANKFTEDVVRNAVQSYVDNLNKQNIDLLHKNKFILSPQNKAVIQDNFIKIGDFADRMKGFEQMSGKAINEYNSPKGYGMYEDPTPLYDEVLNSLSINPETGQIDESRFKVALHNFQNTDSEVPGLNIKPMAPDEMIYKYAQNYKKTHTGNPLNPEVKTFTDPKLGLMQYSVTESPVDWNGFDREAVNSMASDEQGRQAFKFLQQNMTPEEQNIAASKYGMKDQFGRLAENPLNSMMMYYMKDKMGIDKIKTNIFDPTTPTRVHFPKNTGGGDGNENDLSGLNEPRQLNLGGFDIKEGYTNPNAKKLPYVFKGSRVINNGEFGEDKDVSKEVSDYTIASYDKATDGLIIVSDKMKPDVFGKPTIPYQEYRFVPRKGNEKAVKDYLGKKYDEITKDVKETLTDKEYNAWFKDAKNIYKSTGEATESIFKKMWDAGDINKIEYDRFIKMLSNEPDDPYYFKNNKLPQ
jgi:hypothetical protein